MISTIFQFINAAIIQGIPLLFGSTGEIITEKSGNLNLGIPGIMYVGGISGIIGGYLYEHGNESPNAILCVLISMLASLAGSALMSLIYVFLTTTLKANQNVTGLTLTIFGSGVANFFGGSLNTLAGRFEQIAVPFTSAAFKAVTPLSKAGVVGRIFFSYGFMVYLAVIAAVIIHYFLNHTR